MTNNGNRIPLLKHSVLQTTMI